MEHEEQERLLVRLECNVSGKRTLEALSDGILLRCDEGVEGDPDGHINVLVRHVLPEVHLRVGLALPQHALEMPHSHGHAALSRLTTELRKEGGHLVTIDPVEPRMDSGPRIHNVLAKQFL